MGNHLESPKPKTFLLFTLYIVLPFTSFCSTSALQTRDGGLIVSVKGRLEEDKHHVRVSDDKGICILNAPSLGIRKTLRTSNPNPPLLDGSVPARMLGVSLGGLADAHAALNGAADGFSGIGGRVGSTEAIGAANTAGVNSKAHTSDSKIIIIIIIVVILVVVAILVWAMSYFTKKKHSSPKESTIP